MKKRLSFKLLTPLLAALALSLAACSATSLATEERAASPEASEFNRETAENSRTPEEARDSAAAASRRQRASQSATPQ